MTQSFTSRSTTTRRLTSFCLPLALLLSGCTRDCEPVDRGIEAHTGPVATLDGERILLEDVRPDVAFQVYQRQVDIYSLLRGETEALIDARLLAREAARRGVATEELLRQEVESQVVPATDADVDAYLADHPEAASKGPSVRERVALYLSETRKIERRLALMKELRDRASIVFLLETPVPPRVRVAIDDAPARGPADAAVTLVHFATFSSALSARSARYIHKLVEEFPGQIRWVHRHYLNDRDEVGLLAARLTVAAAEEDRFWDFHDRLFERDGRITADEVRTAAEAIGLSAARRQAAESEPRYLAAVKRDVDAGNKAGVKREPVIFVNGLYFSSTFPYERVRDLVAEETENAARR